MMEEISAHFYKHKIIMKRRPADLAWIFLHPLIGLLSIGLLVFFIISKGAPIDSMLFVFVGVTMWNFYDLSQRAITYAITMDIWNTCLKHGFSGKSAVKHFIVGNSIFGLYSSTIAFVLVGVIGFFIFGFNIFAAGPYLLNLFTVFVFAISIGLMIDALMLAYGEKYLSLVWMLTGLVMIFSGVYYPVGILPHPISDIAYALPSTHAINSMRSALMGTGSELIEFGVGFGISLIYFSVGCFLFSKGLKKGYTNGTITKY